MIDILTFILVVITGFYAWVTFRILKANQDVVNIMADQQEAILRPYVTISQFCPPNDASFYLKISNTGKTAAINLRITPNSDYFRLAERLPSLELHKFPAFKQTIDSFPPGAEIIFLIEHCSAVFGKETEEEVGSSKMGFNAEYSFGKKSFSETTNLDLRQYFRSDIPEDVNSKSLKGIEEAIKKGTDSIRKAVETRGRA